MPQCAVPSWIRPWTFLGGLPLYRYDTDWPRWCCVKKGGVRRSVSIRLCKSAAFFVEQRPAPTLLDLDLRRLKNIHPWSRAVYYPPNFV